MFVKELWRYPVKSLAGERVRETQVTRGGFPDDRKILVMGPNSRMITSRTHHKLLGLQGSIGANGQVLISGHPWDSPEALALVQEVAGPTARLVFHEGVDRFDILPLLVATDGAIDHMEFDSRRFRPNILVGGVHDLDERTWPGHRLKIGDVVVEPAQLRGRCVMTTYDPDTLKQDRTVLKRIVDELGGTLALDTAVVTEGTIHEGDEVLLL